MENTNPLVEALRELNKVANNGRGSSTVRGILFELDRGNLNNANAVWNNDGDKLTQYPELELAVINLLGCRIHNVQKCQNSLCKSLKKYAEKWANQ